MILLRIAIEMYTNTLCVVSFRYACATFFRSDFFLDRRRYLIKTMRLSSLWIFWHIVHFSLEFNETPIILSRIIHIEITWFQSLEDFPLQPSIMAVKEKSFSQSFGDLHQLSRKDFLKTFRPCYTITDWDFVYKSTYSKMCKQLLLEDSMYCIKMELTNNSLVRNVRKIKRLFLPELKHKYIERQT